MADKTLIAWTDHTFNPWMGCHKVSPGCKHCYAEVLVKNRMGKPGMWGATGVRTRTKGPWLKVPKWNAEAELEGRPHRVFCASLADVFEDYPGPNEWRADVWRVIRENPWLDFQLLTKRPENIARMLPDDWDTAFAGHRCYPNVWLGTSIEDNRVAERGAILTQTRAVVHFVSYEPAIGPLDKLPLDGIEWMIVGGESGPGHRKLDLDWARDMRQRCADVKPPDHTAFFFKQMSGHHTEMGIDALGEVVRRYPRGWDRSSLTAAQPQLPADAFDLMPKGKHGNHVKASRHYRWNPRIVASNGYVRIKVGRSHPEADRNGYAYEHRVVVLSAGIEIPPGHEIHHKNEDKEDNRLENLEVIDRKLHRRLRHARHQLDDQQAARGVFPQDAEPEASAEVG